VNFAREVRRATQFLAGVLQMEHHFTYVRDARRAEEAEAVDPCVQRFVEYEVDPPADGRGVGRFAPASPAPLGQLLDRSTVEALDDESQAILRESVALGVAIGYVGLAALESDAEGIDPRVDLDPEEAWTHWVARLDSPALDAANLDAGFQSAFRGRAADHFAAGLDAIGLLPRFRKRARIGQLAEWYGQAGMLLRLVQVGAPTVGDPDYFREVADAWPFEREPPS